MKLQSKIVLLIAPFVMVPLLATGWTAYRQLGASAEQRMLYEMATLVHQLELRTAAYLDNARANTQLFADSSRIQRYLATDDESDRYELLQPSLFRLFASYQRAYPEYYEIRLVLPDGFEDTRLVAGGLPNRTEDESASEWFIAATLATEDMTSTIGRNPDDGEVVLYIVKRLRISDPSEDPALAVPQTRGYLVVTSRLDFLAAQARETGIGESGVVFFSDADGVVLFHRDAGRIGQPLPGDLRPGNGHAGGERVPLQGMHAGEAVRYESARLHPDLYVFSVLPAAELSAAGQRLAKLIVPITLFSILGTGLLLYLALRWLLLTPIRTLAAAADDIGRGNLGLTVDVARRDELGELALSFNDMSRSLRHGSEQVHFLAYHDGLTGLPNRRLVLEQLARALAQARRHGHLVALLFLDLDNFKQINDTLGHQVGDQLLEAFAARLQICLREDDVTAREAHPVRASELPALSPTDGDTVGRIGGDEFIVLLSRIEHSLDAALVAKRVLDVLAAPFDIDGHELFISASIGITVFPDDGADGATLMRCADIAMYQAKERGRNTYEFFTDSLNTAALERLGLEIALRKAVDRDEFVLHYQPQVGLARGELEGLEALLRWNHPVRGLLSPDQFIALAEETGLIVPIGDWVLREACRQAMAWREAGLEPGRMAVNLSWRQIERDDFSHQVASVLRASGLAPACLDLELTESGIMRSEVVATRRITALKELGVQVSMDDFGTGYSSLGALRRLPIDHLKIDRSFVLDILEDGDDANLVSGILAMARSLGLRVTAEGVETPAQREFLRRHGCQSLQGYLVSRPLPAEEVVALLPRRLGRTKPATAGG